MSTALLGGMVLFGGSAMARNVVIDTTAMTATGDGDGDPTLFYGQTPVWTLTNGIRTLSIGDVDVSGDSVRVIGDFGLKISSSGNIIARGTTFDVSAVGSVAGAGGGAGGAGGGGGAGGAGGIGAPKIDFNAPGGGGGSSTGFSGDKGTNGLNGFFGFGGSNGSGGLSGFSGQAGVGSVGGGGTGGDASNAGGAFGSGGAPGVATILPPPEFLTGNGGFGGGFGSDGSDGVDGDDGEAGGAGGNGGSGDGGALGQNTGGFGLLSGGSGGGGGGGGAGGGGGGGGGSGQGGGGGGGAGFVPVFGGRTGAPGGVGGAGGNGFTGAEGGTGGTGGGGGGALGLEAVGRIDAVNAVFEAKGGVGQAGGVDGSNTTGGTLGGIGSAGLPGNCGTQLGVCVTQTSGSGGDGGDGGNGGLGGQGGFGGAGGAGAGGTVLLSASVVEADGAVVRVESGAGEGPDGAGRLVFGANTAGPNFNAVTGETQDLGQGARGLNPFVKGGVETPFIPDLFGGADLFGLLDGVDPGDAALGGLAGGAPGNALAALSRFDIGPVPGYDHDFLGFDMLLFTNLSGGDLLNPLLGIDPLEEDSDFLTALLQDSGGEDILDLLGAGQIFATLIPEAGTLFNIGGNGFTASGLLEDGETLFLTGSISQVPLPAAGWMLIGGLGLLAGAARRRKRAR